MNNKFKDLGILIILTFFATILSLALKVNFLVSALLFFALPSIYISFKQKNQIMRLSKFSALMGIPFIIIFDYIMASTNGWIVPKTIFSFRILEVVTIEMIIAMFFGVYFVLQFYTYFLDHHIEKHPKTRLFGVLIGSVFVIFILLYLIWPKLLHIPYAYIILGIIFLALPTILLLITHKTLIKKFGFLGLFFMFNSSLYEYVGLTLGLWEFPGSQYVGTVTINNATLPFEEIIFYIILIAIWVATFYEIFDDDMK